MRITYAVLIGILFFSGCLGGEDPPLESTTLSEPYTTVPSTSTSLSTQQPLSTTLLEPTTTSIPKPVLHEIDLETKRFEFIPAEIRVKKGDILLLRLTSADVNHGFAIDEYDIKVDIPAKETKILQFTADKTGEFTYYCSVYCGSGHGSMKGKLIVE
ncbi:MAG: cupredoxin domain-containing protein [Methanobacteriota archaeon]